MPGMKSTKRDDEPVINNGPHRKGVGSDDLYSQCQDHLLSINTATEHQLTIKDEMKRFSKLERAIAYKKNLQAERLSSILEGDNPLVSKPVWLITSIQSLARRLIQQAKWHCTNTEKLAAFCSGIQGMVDNHLKVMKSVHETDNLTSPTSPGSNSGKESGNSVRPRQARKKTTDRKPDDPDYDEVLLSPPPNIMSKQKDEGVVIKEAKGFEGGGGGGGRVGPMEDFYQACVTFEEIRKKRLAFSNRVEYLKLQQESICSQLEETNALMTGLTDAKGGKFLQWTAQSKLGDVRSRRDFLQNHRKQIKEETGKLVSELQQFDAGHRVALERIRYVFETIKTGYERTLQRSIGALESVVGGDATDDLPLVDSAWCNDQCCGFTKRNVWETFDDKGQPEDGVKGSYGDACATSSCPVVGSPNSRRVDKSGLSVSDSSKGKKSPVKEKVAVSQKKPDNSPAKPFPIRGILTRSLGPNVSESVSDESPLLGKETSSSSCSKDGNQNHDFNQEVCSRLGRRSTHSLIRTKSTERAKKMLKGVIKIENAEEDRTNNHDFEMSNTNLMMFDEKLGEIPTDESPAVILVRDERVKYPDISSGISESDLDLLDRVSSRVREEDEAINRYLNKYLLQLGGYEASAFDRIDTKSQRVQSLPKMLLSNQKSLDEKKTSGPVVISLEEKSSQKFELHCSTDSCPRPVGLFLSNSSKRCSESDNSKEIYFNDLSRDSSSSADEQSDSTPMQSPQQQGYNISVHFNPDKGGYINNECKDNLDRSPEKREILDRSEEGDGEGNQETKQINSFLALMAKETKALFKQLEPESLNLSYSDSDSPSSVTSLSYSSLTPALYCPDTILWTGVMQDRLEVNDGRNSGWGDVRGKGSSYYKRVRFNEEIEYSPDPQECNEEEEVGRGSSPLRLQSDDDDVNDDGNGDDASNDDDDDDDCNGDDVSNDDDDDDDMNDRSNNDENNSKVNDSTINTSITTSTGT